jgi:hypothetical protein
VVLGATGRVHHQRVVVGDVADLAVVAALAQVADQVHRTDDGLGLESDRGTGDPGQCTEGAGDGVHLRLVLRVGAEPFEHERDGVQPQHLHAEIGQEQHDVGVLEEDVGIRPVDVPLPGVERRPHPRLQGVLVGEAARREVREDLGQGALVGVGHGAVREKVEVVLVPLLARPRPFGPEMFAGNVIEHEIQDEADSVAAQCGGQIRQVRHRAEIRTDRAVVGDRVAAVAVTGPRGEQRHQVQIGHPQLLQVPDAVGDAGQRPPEALGVGGVAQHPGGLEPVRGQRPFGVQQVEFGIALAEGGGGQRHQALAQRGGDPAGVYPAGQVLPPAVQPQREGVPEVLLAAGQFRCGDGMDGVRGTAHAHIMA